MELKDILTIKEINNATPLNFVFLMYNPSDKNETDPFNFTQETSKLNIPVFSCKLENKTYTADDLTENIPENLEAIVLNKLIESAEVISNPNLSLEELIVEADISIYNSTKKVLSNILITNTKNKVIIKRERLKRKLTKKIIYTDNIPENIYLVIANNEFNIPAVLLLGKDKYKLDIINKDLIKVIKKNV